jgi:AcrR family transcriptional regulator
MEQTEKIAGQRDGDFERRLAVARARPAGRYAQRRQEIFDAAAEVFRRRGYHGTTFGDIADELGADRASLYYYVSGKEEILEALVSEVVKVNLAEAIAIRDGDGGAPEKLRALVEGLMASYGEHFPTIYILIQENLAELGPERGGWAREMREVNHAYEAVVTEVIEAGQADGTIAAEAPPRLLAYGIIGMVGWTNRWFNPGQSTFDAAEIGGAFADTLLEGLVR